MLREADDVITVERVQVKRVGEMGVKVATHSTGMRSLELWAGGQVIFALDAMDDGSITDADGVVLGTGEEVRTALRAMLERL